MDEDGVLKLIYILLFVAFAGLIGVFFIEGEQDKTVKPKTKYMMDDYGNIYEIKANDKCSNCFNFYKVDTAEIKIKAFDFVPR
jgi:hypothetical protein